MKNFVQSGNTITVAAPTGGVASGAGVLFGSLFGVAATTGAEGASVEVVTEGVFDLTKATGAGTALTAGGKAYFDATAKKITGAASGNTLIGVALAAATDSAATARVRLNGAAT